MTVRHSRARISPRSPGLHGQEDISAQLHRPTRPAPPPLRPPSVAAPSRGDPHGAAAASQKSLRPRAGIGTGTGTSCPAPSRSFGHSQSTCSARRRSVHRVVDTSSSASDTEVRHPHDKQGSHAQPVAESPPASRGPPCSTNSGGPGRRKRRWKRTPRRRRADTPARPAERRAPPAVEERPASSRTTMLNQRERGR